MTKRFLFVVLTIAFGAFAGAFTWVFFFLMNSGIHLLWDVVPTQLEHWGLPAVAYPVLFCALGGLVIGCFTKRFGPYPDDLNAVMAQVKETGRYEYDHLGASFFGALFPLLFGGSIGPEAGLTGVVAGLCTWIGDRLRFVGTEMRQLANAGTAAVISAIFATPLFGLMVPMVGAADGSDGQRLVSTVTLEVSKPLKVAVYVLAAAGALCTMGILGHFVGGGGGLPRYGALEAGVSELTWFIPCALIGALAGWLFFPFGALARRISNALGERVVLKPVVAGVVLGACGIVLPFSMFAGEAQTEQLMEAWTSMAAVVLIGTGFVKVFVTQACLNMGWRGGHFFPIIFAGISLGYGMAALAGVDPVFAVCATTAALMGAVMRQPLMTVVLLFLVFPVAGAPILLVAAALGSLIPVPKRWLGE